MNANEKKTRLDTLEQFDDAQRRILNILLLSCVVFIIWAAWSPLDILSIATGTVEPASRVQTIQHLEGGIIRKLLIQEGDKVKQNQALVELEITSSGSAYGEVLARVVALSADLVRLEAEANNKDVLVFDTAFQNQHPELVQRTINLFEARRKQLKTALQSQKQEIKVRKEAQREINTRIKHAVARLVLVKEQIEIEKELLANALSNRYEHLERLKEINRLRSDISEGRASANKAKALQAQAQSNLEKIQTNYNQEVQTAISDSRRELNEGQQRLEKFKDSLARTTLRAPMDGVIKTLYVVTEGGVIAPGGVVLDMVPEREGLIVVAKLPPQDIGHVQLDQIVFVQLASSEASHYGRISGRVTHISPDTIKDKEGQVFYVVRIAMDQDHFEKGNERYRLSPGVMVTAGIVTGKRSVLEYLLSPIIQTFPFSLSER